MQIWLKTSANIARSHDQRAERVWLDRLRRLSPVLQSGRHTSRRLVETVNTLLILLDLQVLVTLTRFDIWMSRSATNQSRHCSID